MASFHSKARISLGLLLSLLFLCSFLSFSANGKDQREFDYFALALQWPGTYCQRTKYCCPSNGCCRGSLAPTEFTIHGLWPDYNDGSWPACCSNSRFDSKKIKSLTGMLERYWPSLSCSSSSVCHGGKGIFWAHEWEKHGTCSYPVIKDEYDYFSAVLDLYSKYNITKVLFDAGFVPTNNIGYPLKDIISTIEETFGVSPLVVCKDGAVEELHICFYKDFTPRDCLTGSNAQEGMLNSRRSSCPRNVSLPEYVPLMLKGENATSTWLSDGEAL